MHQAKQLFSTQYPRGLRQYDWDSYLNETNMARVVIEAAKDISFVKLKDKQKEAVLYFSKH